MRQVRTCDFCGDDAAGVYEPLPPSIPDAPRMILCEACRDRLSTVVDPLLAEIDGDSGGRATRASGDPEAESSGEAESSVGSDDASGADGSADRPGGDDLEARDWPTDPGEPADVAPGRAADDSAGGTDGPSRPTEHARDPTESRPSSIEDLADADGDPDVEVSESRDASGRTQRERDGAPRGYRKVIRFLENRELPIDRTDAETLAAEAYDLDEGAVADAIDHAVQYGRLREVSGELKQ